MWVQSNTPHPVIPALDAGIQGLSFMTLFDWLEDLKIEKTKPWIPVSSTGMTAIY
jgi:hypothetical protein